MQISSNATCVTFDLIQDIRVKETKPSFVTVYDYYRTDVRKTVTYSLTCSTPGEDPLQAHPTLFPIKVASLVTVEPQRDVVEVGSNYTMYCKVNRMWTSQTSQDLIWSRWFPPLFVGVLTKPLPANVQSIMDDVTKSITLLNMQREDADLYVCYLAGETRLSNAGISSVDVIGCPVCEDELPSDWEDKFCRSYYAAVVRAKAKNRVKVLERYRFGEENIDRTVRYTLDNQCSCQLEQGKRYIIFTDNESLDEDRREMTVKETALIVPFKAEYLQTLKQSICPFA